MEKKRVVLEEPLNIFGRTLMVVARTSIYTCQCRGSLTFWGLKEPLYLLVKEITGEVTSFNMDGQRVTTEDILTRNPELRKSLPQY